MKIILLLLLSLPGYISLFSQHIAIAADKNNFFYAGIDNPITITAENCACASIVAKTGNGIITGNGCNLTYFNKNPGTAEIKLFKKTGNFLKEIGSAFFRVKNLPPPAFKVGPYGNSYYNNYDSKVIKVVLNSQDYVRAELENFDFNIKFTVDSFRVKIISTDSCRTKEYFNTTNKINTQLHDAFAIIKKNDIIIFYKIFVKGPDQNEWELAPLIMTIEN